MGGWVCLACGPVGESDSCASGGDAGGRRRPDLHSTLFASGIVPAATHGPFSHLLPTYINSSESSSKIDAQKKKHKKKQTQQERNRSGRARRINLSLSLAPRPEPLSLPAATAGRADGRTDGVLKQC